MDFKDLKAMLDRNREQKSIEEDDLESNLCPQCFWQLKANSKGERVCPICGTNYTH